MAMTSATDDSKRTGLDAVDPRLAAGEAAWIEVIRKMDETYADLVHYQVELEQKNSALEDAQMLHRQRARPDDRSWSPAIPVSCIR